MLRNGHLFVCVWGGDVIPNNAPGPGVCVWMVVPLPCARFLLKPSGLMNSNRKTAIAVTMSNMTNIMTHTDALNGSAGRQMRKTGSQGKITKIKN